MTDASESSVESTTTTTEQPQDIPALPVEESAGKKDDNSGGETANGESAPAADENAEKKEEEKAKHFTLAMEVEMRIEVLKEDPEEALRKAALKLNASVLASMAPLDYDELKETSKSAEEQAKETETKPEITEEKTTTEANPDGDTEGISDNKKESSEDVPKAESTSEAPKEATVEEEDIEYGPITVTLLDGTCECFGSELIRNKDYTFVPGTVFSLFTWSGCHLKIKGGAFSHTLSSTTPMKDYMTLHARLENLRSAARSHSSFFSGPKIVICGAVDCGKSTLCQMLLNWAVRAGVSAENSHGTPIFVDTDVGQNGITIPGSFAACVVDTVTPIGFEEKERRQCELPQNEPLVLWYGKLSPGDDEPLFLFQLGLLASYCKQKMENDPLCKVAGCVVNTCGWVERFGFKALMETIRVFEADIVAVLNNEPLVQQIKDEMAKNPRVYQRTPELIPLRKSDSVVVRPQTMRKKKRSDRVNEYFYGELRTFSPFKRNVKFGDMHLYQTGSSPNGTLEVTPISPASLIPGTVLAVMHTDSPDRIVTANVAGFFLVVDKPDLASKTVLLLSPCPGPIPSQYFLKSTYQA